MPHLLRSLRAKITASLSFYVVFFRQLQSSCSQKPWSKILEKMFLYQVFFLTVWNKQTADIAVVKFYARKQVKLNWVTKTV